MLERVFNKIEREQELNKDDIISLLALEDEEKLKILYRLADRYRQKYVGEEVHLRGLIEFSNYCRKNCFYCGIRWGNQKANRYRMSLDEILDNVNDAEKLGYKTVVLQSGEDLYYTSDKLVDLVKKIKQRSDVAVTLSIGERPIGGERAYAQCYAG
ncbi:radical SAM protein [Pelotomaculum propionicicum]|uniref:radical SAM protein n=1 Tax=Pelotomaculum propionicicum TaxID=258475 RepID=UPI003D07208B